MDKPGSMLKRSDAFGSDEEGESGAGNENAACASHSASPSRGPFIAVNCATIPEGIAARLLSLQRNQLRREIAHHNIDVSRLKDPKKG